MSIIDKIVGRATELPATAPTEPVHVNVVCTVTSPNEQTSPVSGMSGALVVLTLIARAARVGPAFSPNTPTKYSNEVLGAVAFGDAVVLADANGRSLTVPTSSEGPAGLAIEIHPLD
jgi:hypothetical protein